ncbi:MAG: caspase family protein [Casimicrobiaceae bacterium]
MHHPNHLRRQILKGGLGAASLFLPLPYAFVWAQSDGVVKLVRAPKVALVLGNADYLSAPALRNPVNDATAVAGVLRDFGFDVTVKQNGSRAEMEAAIAAYTLRLAQGRGVGVFFYAGHGLQLSWTNFLVPIDASIHEAEDVQAACVDLSVLMVGMRKAANPMNIVILDACRENPFEGDFKVTNKGLSQMDAPNDTLLAYATAPGNVASDGDGGNGLYTESLIKEIRVPEARVEDVFKRVRLNVRRKTGGAQVPWESTSLDEDFWFLPPPQVIQVAEARTRGEAEAQRIAATEEGRRKSADARREAEAERRAKAEAPPAREAGASDGTGNEQKFKEELARWDAIRNSRNAQDFYAFLLERPSGYLAEQAQFRLDQLERPTVVAQPGPDGIKPFLSGTNRYALGDEFTYLRQDHLTNTETVVTSKVTYADNERVEFNGGEGVRDQMGSVLRNRFGTKNPGVLLVPSTIAVGKRWRSAFTNTNPRGVVGTNYWDFRVVALEEIRLPAGVFRAFKVAGTGEVVAPNGQTLLASTTWIDPVTMIDIRQELKFHYMSGRRVMNTENSSYQLVKIVLARR